MPRVKLMMKRLAFWTVSIAWMIWFVGTPAEAQQSTSESDRKLELLNAYPDLLVVNGNIATMDDKLTEVEAMAVRNGRILALGTNQAIRFLAGPKTEVLDAKGRRVLPGLIDSHTHPHVWAVEHYMGEENYAAPKYHLPEMRIVYAKGKDKLEVLRSLERAVLQRAQELGPGKWIWVTLFGGNNIVESRDITWPLFAQGGGAGGTITRDLLDTLAPDNPLIVFTSEAIGPDEHNTKAKEEMIKVLGYEVSGLTARTRVPYDIMLRGRTADIADMLKHELMTCLLPQGFTTYANHYYGAPSIMKAHNYLYQRGELPVRWAWWEGTLWAAYGDKSSVDDLRFFYQNLGDFRGIGNDYIWNAGISNEAWESGLTCTTAKLPRSPGSENASQSVEGLASSAASAGLVLTGPMPDCATAQINYDKEVGFGIVKAGLEAGLRIGYLHGYSDGTYDALFHMIEQAMAEGKLTLEEVRALRIGTEHNPIIRPDQVQKMGKYNMMPSFQGYQVQGDLKGGSFMKTYGEQVLSWIAPMKTLVDAGAHPVLSTDMHMFKDTPESKPMDIPPQWDGNIWAFIEFFVTRRMPNNTISYLRSEAMDRVSMMKSATIWGAERALNEKNIGSLEIGKLADFIVIDKDFFTIPEDQIHTIKTLLTVVGGKTGYKDSNF
ncbi:MAG: amidohydrolase family protein [Acidobacteria bacterium]|nr:amidohydrolase family protein [Acidobacteriota bacterium]